MNGTRLLIGRTNVFPPTHLHADDENVRNGTRRDAAVVSISMVREPVRRALSAFSYAPPHTNRVGKCKDSFSRACVLRFLRAGKYQNVATKMFSGNVAYAVSSPCQEQPVLPLLEQLGAAKHLVRAWAGWGTERHAAMCGQLCALCGSCALRVRCVRFTWFVCA